MRVLPTFLSLRSFLDWCGDTGQLLRVADKVSVRHQITAVHRAVLERGGPVLRFDHPTLAGGSPAEIPVVVNLFGTPERVAAGLGITLDRLDELAAFLAALRSPSPPDGLRDALSRWPMLKAALATRPKIIKAAPVHECVLEGPRVDLSALPVQNHWPGDAGALITWPVVVTRPHGSAMSEINRYNAGVYRAQVISSDRVIMRWLPHRGGAAHHQSWARQGLATPVAIVLGADPAALLSAALPLPETVSELTFAGAPQIDLMVKSGMLDAETARHHPDRNCLTSVLMGREIAKMDCNKPPLELRPGNIVIVSSDGLQFLSNQEIQDIVKKHRDCRSSELVDALMQAVEDLGDPDQDNISFAVIKVK